MCSLGSVCDAAHSDQCACNRLKRPRGAMIVLPRNDPIDTTAMLELRPDDVHLTYVSRMNGRLRRETAYDGLGTVGRPVETADAAVCQDARHSDVHVTRGTPSTRREPPWTMYRRVARVRVWGREPQEVMVCEAERLKTAGNGRWGWRSVGRRASHVVSSGSEARRKSFKV